MAATTTQLGLVTPTQGTLSGTWGDTVNNGITEYVNIAIAGTLSFAGDGAITLANTTGSASASNIGSTTAQYMVIQVTGTLTTPKIITGPSYSKLYLVDNAATGSTVSFIRAGQTPAVSIAVGEKAFVYYNGTDYVKISSISSTGVLPVASGGTNASTASITSFNNITGYTASGATGTTSTNLVFSTSPTLVTPVLGTPTSGTLSNCTVDGTNAVGFRSIPPVGTKTSSYTLATGDVGKYVQVGSGGSIVIPDATFSEGNAISIFNNTSGNITITCTITTAYLAGTDADKATVTLATRGVANIFFISGTVCVITGNVS